MLFISVDEILNGLNVTVLYRSLFLLVWSVEWTKSHCILCYFFLLMKCWMDQRPLCTMLFVSVDEVLNGPKSTVYCVISFSWSVEWTKIHCVLCYFFQLKCWMDQKPLCTMLFISVDEVLNGPKATILCYLFQLMKCWMDQRPLCTMLYRRPNQTTRAKTTPRMKLKIWWDRKRIREKLQPATCKILNILSVCTLMLQWVINPL